MNSFSRLATLLMLAALLTAPAFASSILYTNGPINGGIDAWGFTHIPSIPTCRS